MSKKHKIGVTGAGMVGGQVVRYFEERQGHKRGESLFVYDTDPKKRFGDDVRNADIVFVCVPTPMGKGGAPDLSRLVPAFDSLGQEGKIVVIKSTVPPGTTERFQRQYPQHQVLFNPEFLTEKQAWEDFIKPDRQIVGFTAHSVDAAGLVRSLLPKAPFMSPWGLNTYRPIKITATEAEFIKYAGNVYFARKVAYANALAQACEAMARRLKSDGIVSDMEYDNVREGIAADYRIGDSHLDVVHGGYRGFGGYCLPKDYAAFMTYFKDLGLHDQAAFLRSDWDFNERLLQEQGLTIEDVSVHDQEWIRKKRKQ